MGANADGERHLNDGDDWQDKIVKDHGPTGDEA